MKLYLSIFYLIFFKSTIILNNAEFTPSKNNSTRICILLESDKEYCTQKDGDISFKISIDNRNFIPKIKKNLCISLHDWSRHMIVLNVVHNEVSYMNNYSDGKCVLPSSNLLIKGFPVSKYKIVDFNCLVTYNNKNYLVRTKNTDYGIYSIQAIYVLKKDTLYSNKILIEFRKD